MKRFIPLLFPLIVLGFGCASADSPSASSTSEVEADASTTTEAVNEETAIENEVEQPELNPDLPPIIDTHAHIYPVSKEANEAYVDDLVAAAMENGVSKILLGLNARQVPDRPPTFSSEHDEMVLDAYERYPDVIVPTLNGFDPEDEAAPEYVREQLKTGKWKMVGELDVRNPIKQNSIAADSDVLMDIYDIAGEYHVPVMLHFTFAFGTDAESGKAELERALSGNPDTIFIYAHSCASEIALLMRSHDNLYCEQESGSPAPGIDFSRVILGTDIQVTERAPEKVADHYADVIDALRDTISTWSDADQLAARIETPTALFGL